MKYRLKSFDGKIVDKTVEDTWRRVSSALASRERNKKYWKNIFYNSLTNFQLIPAGRISRGAGTHQKVTLINTFVMGMVPDNLEGILQNFKESALTLSYGGGIGCNFSEVRPKGAYISGIEAASVGPITFMEMWDQLCKGLVLGGLRRGAMMAMLRCDHPDIDAFIEAKKIKGELNKFNMSVLITDNFMNAVKKNKEWNLVFEEKVYKTIRARDLWKKIMNMTYEYSEPGVLFIDRINSKNKLSYCEEIVGTNSCGELPLPEYGCCPLGSVNLTKLIENPFTSEAKLNVKQFKHLTEVGIRLLDNVLDLSKYPLSQQRIEAKNKRRIGLGITGLADALIMCRVLYGSKKSLELLEEWLRIFRHTSYETSIQLAKERGQFPLLNRDQFVSKLKELGIEQDIIEAVKKYGIRNGTLNAIPPTGTTSLYAGNISSGIEPVYSFEVNRKILLSNGRHKVIDINDYVYEKYKKVKTNRTKTLPSYFVDMADIKPYDHLAIQAIAQRYIDASIAKTINCPTSIRFNVFENIYKEAYKLGCKGCTTYRASKVRNYVLKSSSKSENDD